jgi:hypothetical protein
VNDTLVTSLYFLACFGLIGAAHWRTWARTVPAFAAGRRSRAATLLAVASWQLAGLLVPAGLLMGLVGVEEVVKTPLVPERIALGAFGITALQLLASLATFGAAVWRTRAR